MCIDVVKLCVCVSLLDLFAMWFMWFTTGPGH